jgi:hypothetical protein
MPNTIRSSFDRRSGVDRRTAYTLGYFSGRRNRTKERQGTKTYGRKEK